MYQIRWAVGERVCAQDDPEVKGTITAIEGACFVVKWDNIVRKMTYWKFALRWIPKD